MSEAWRRSIGSVVRWEHWVDWSVDGMTWTAVRALACQVTEDAGQQVRWRLDVDLLDLPRDVDPYGALLRPMVRHTGTGEIEQVGLYRVETSRRAARSRTTSLTGVSLEQALLDARLPGPLSLPRGSAGWLMGLLIRQVMPAADLTFDRARDARVQVAAMVVVDDRWQAISGGRDSKSIGKALGAVVHTDARGAFRVAPTVGLDSTPIGVIRSGRGGVQLSSAEALSRESVRNAVIVKGASTDPDADVLGPLVVFDDDPYSPTYARSDPLRGGFGMVPLRYTSPVFTHESQLLITGRAMLAPRLGLLHQLDFEQLYDPSVRAGTVWQVEGPSGDRVAVIDSVRLDLAAHTMSATVRASASDSAGRVGALVDVTDVDIQAEQGA